MAAVVAIEADDVEENFFHSGACCPDRGECSAETHMKDKDTGCIVISAFKM